MKNYIFLLSFLFISVTSVQAQWWSNKKVNGNGNYTTQNRNVSSYDAVSLTGGMDVELVAGTEGKLTVEAESNLMEYITTEVSGGTLKISVEKGVSLRPSKNHGIKVTVPVKEIEEVNLTGSGDIWNTGTLHASEFKIGLTGSGDIKLNINSQNIDGSITGSGDVALRGNTNNLNCKTTGSGDFKAYDLQAEEVNAQISGSGDMEVNASKLLKARISGSGDIRFKGKPEKQDFKTFGSGSISSY